MSHPLVRSCGQLNARGLLPALKVSSFSDLCLSACNPNLA